MNTPKHNPKRNPKHNPKHNPMRNLIRHLLRGLDHLEEWLIATLMGGATLLIFVAVLHRYATGWPIPGLQDALLKINLSWAQEACIFMFVWMAKFGAAYGVRTGIHVGVDVLLNRLATPWRARMIIFGLLAGALFTGLITAYGIHFVHGTHADSVSPDMEMPMWIVYLAIPLGSGLMCFRFLQVAWQFVQTGQLPKHDHSHVEGLEQEVGQFTPVPPGNPGQGGRP